MDIKGIIFDFDGTLFDTMFIWNDIGINYLLAQGKTPRDGIVKACEKLTLSECADYFINEYGVSFDNETICKGLLEMADDFYRYNAMPKVGVKEFVQKQFEGGVKMCIATATEKSLVKKALERCDMSEYFSDIFTCSEIGKSKRFPDIYLRAMESLQTNFASTVVFEDTYHAAKTAKDAGFYVIAIEDNANVHSKEETIQLCDRYILSFGQMLDA